MTGWSFPIFHSTTFTITKLEWGVSCIRSSPSSPSSPSSSPSPSSHHHSHSFSRPASTITKGFLHRPIKNIFRSHGNIVLIINDGSDNVDEDDAIICASSIMINLFDVGIMIMMMIMVMVVVATMTMMMTMMTMMVIMMIMMTMTMMTMMKMMVKVDHWREKLSEGIVPERDSQLSK